MLRKYQLHVVLLLSIRNLQANHGLIEISNSQAPKKYVSIEWTLTSHLLNATYSSEGQQM